MANYDRINWQNGAAGGTRLNADNLNHMDEGIKDLETKFLSFVNTYQSDINKKANKTDPTTSGTMTHTGDATISGILKAQQALVTPSANAAYLSTDTINVNTRGGDVTVIPKLIAQGGIELDELNLSSWLDTLGSDITKNAQAIAELEDRPAGIELEGVDVLTTSAVAKIRAIDVKGKSSQHISKNILVPSLASGSKNGISYTVDNNKITISGTATAGTALTIGSTDVVQGSVYTLSVNGPASSGLTVVSGYIGTVQMTGNHMTKTSTASASTTATTQLGIASGTTVNGTYTFQVEKGETDTDYDPYTGQPTPANPIPIVDASGVIQAHTRNLFDKSKIISGKRLSTSNNIVYPADLIADSIYYTSGLIEVEEGKTYTKNSPIVDVFHRYSFYDADRVAISKNTGNTFTIPAGIKYVAFCGIETEKDQTMLIEGTAAGEYIEYAANQISLDGNIFTGFEYIEQYINASGQILPYDTVSISYLMEVKNSQFTVAYKRPENVNYPDWIAEYNAAGTFLRRSGPMAATGQSGSISGTFTVGSDCKFIRFTMNNRIEDLIVTSSPVLSVTLRSVGTVADELIVYPDKTGKIIQRIDEFTPQSIDQFGGTTAAYGIYFLMYAPKNVKLDLISKIIECDKAVFIKNADWKDEKSKARVYRAASSASAGIWYQFAYGYTEYDTAEKCAEFAKTLKIHYVMETPIETPLTAAQVKAILALQTYNPETIIETELSLQSVGYTGDTKDYIDSKFTYSTEEILIGSWEGAPLYRRMMYFTSPSVANQDNIYRFDPDENCEPKLFTGTIYDSNGNLLPLNYYWSDSEKVKTEVWDTAVGKFTMNVGSALTNKECKIIIDYIKPYDYTSTASVSTLSDETNYGWIDTPDMTGTVSAVEDGE